MAPRTAKRSRTKKSDIDGGDGEDENAENGDDDDERRLRRRKGEFDALHQEMELVAHGVAKSGQSVRKIPRYQSVQRTQKRKLLEKQDDDHVYTQITAAGDGSTTNRIRGSMAAAEDRVIQGSLIFGSNISKQQQQQNETLQETEDDDVGLTSDDGDDDNKGEGEGFTEEDDEGGESSDEDGEGDVDDDDDDDDNDDGGTEQLREIPLDSFAFAKTSKLSKAKLLKAKLRKEKRPSNARKRKRLQRVKNFRSSKMAEKHGAALGAHVRGKPGLAIRRLKQVAREAPSAPQIYSSLGMVYEDMLHESQRRGTTFEGKEVDQEADTRDTENINGSGKESRKPRVSFSTEIHVSIDFQDEQMEVQDAVLRNQLNLAKKAYGSYHVASCLCKRDYSLWLRAADSASEIAALHTTIMLLPGITNDIIEYHRAEKHRWLEEAKNDYQTADNLSPPGIDVPAKLAHVMIEIGHLSEALTLLTDLKNHADFDASYRAWLLYADLMLRIGHECTQWNRGVQTNSNFMFRRWLRKLSATFDWQERRLQALAKALEAACGSNSCGKFMNWLRNRVEGRIDLHPAVIDVLNADGDVDKSPGTTNEHGKEASLSVRRVVHATAGDCFENEKDFLLLKNRAELEAFDKDTEEMHLMPNSQSATAREVARSNLVMKHKSALVALVGELHHRLGATKPTSPSMNSQSLNASEQRRELPLSASCKTVFTIASELLRHMLSMQLYDGGRLAGEAVSSYLKERATARDKRCQAGREFDHAQKRPISIFAMQRETYDAAENDSDDDEQSNEALLSDDDVLDQSDDTLLGPLRNGILPPEIRFLYGLCLASEGGKAFLASACIQSINDLVQEPCSWLTEQMVDTSVATDSLWILFRRSMTESFGRIAALAFAADVLHKSGKEREMAERVATLFRRHASEFARNGMLDVVLRMEGRNDPVASQRQNDVVKVLVAETRYEVERAESQLLRGDDLQDSGINRTVLEDAIDSLSKLLPVVWKVDSDGSISSTSSEAVDALSRSFRLFSAHAKNLAASRNVRSMEVLVNKMVKTAFILCGASSLTINDHNEMLTTEFTTLPLQSSWLTPDLALLSRRVFNLCVATNVSLFSGWEPDEFSVRLLRGEGHNFFGITMDDGQVAGFVSDAIEAELVEQWELVQTRLPESFAFDFRAKLKTLRDSVWYKESRERQATTEARHRIVFYGEDVALSALLSFSRVCLVFATDNVVNEKLYLIALSILLPVSQFCLNESLWDASIGQRAASGSSGTREWCDILTLNKGGDQRLHSTFRLRSRRISSSVSDDQSDLALHEWFSWENDSDPLSNLISIPLSKIQKTWRRYNDPPNITRGAAVSSVELMREVDMSIAKLRACYTTQAVEKASLNVASGLIRLAACSECCNPFLCLHQAAMYAGQASKGGTSDQIFQTKLPKPEACTPLDALFIIGRADCLQAMHFCQEASFLCSYAATVCSLHRNLLWNERWSIIASLAYDLSVIIRYLAGVMLDEHDKRDDIGTWSLAVIEEFSLARVDGLAFKMQAISTSDTNKDCARAANLLPHVINPSCEIHNTNITESTHYHSNGERAEDTSTLDFVPAMEELAFSFEETLEELSIEETPDDSVNAIEMVAV